MLSRRPIRLSESITTDFHSIATPASALCHGVASSKHDDGKFHALYTRYKIFIAMQPFKVERQHYKISTNTNYINLIVTQEIKKKKQKNNNKMLSYRRKTALRGALVLAKSGRLELGDNTLRTL